jgi:hypothetical protein
VKDALFNALFKLRLKDETLFIRVLPEGTHCVIHPYQRRVDAVVYNLRETEKVTDFRDS